MLDLAHTRCDGHVHFVGIGLVRRLVLWISGILCKRALRHAPEMARIAQWIALLVLVL